MEPAACYFRGPLICSPVVKINSIFTVGELAIFKYAAGPDDVKFRPVPGGSGCSKAVVLPAVWESLMEVNTMGFVAVPRATILEKTTCTVDES